MKRESFEVIFTLQDPTPRLVISRADRSRFHQRQSWEVIFVASCVGEFATRFGNRAAEFARGFDPFRDDDLRVCHGFRVSLTVGHATRQFRYFDNKALVFFAPVNDQFVTHGLEEMILTYQ